MTSPNDSGMEDEASEQDQCTCLDRILKPLTRPNIIHHYIPLAGGVCYTAMSAHVTNPQLLKRFTTPDPINILLSTSLAGTSLYIYNCKHLKAVQGRQRILYSLFSAGFFNLGSVLLWAMIRSATLSRYTGVQTTRAIVAVGTSIILVKTGMDYLNAIDAQVPSPSKKHK